jgi:hypothetical protein
MANIDNKTAFISGLKKFTNDFLDMAETAHDNLSKKERASLVDLSKDKSIIVSKADKGNAVVIQNTTDYKRKVLAILSDATKFKRLQPDPSSKKSNPTITRQKALQTRLRGLKSRLPEGVYDRVYPSGSKAGVMYGLPKVHKEGTPLRPIISATGTYNFHLAKWLDEILKPLIPNTYTLKDTFDFVNKIGDLDPTSDKYLVSFDVESLFTNVPTLETIDIILNLAFKTGNKDERFFNMSRVELKKLLIICTSESHFQFGGNYYDQVDGVAMGSPLGPLFANAFMADFENKHMDRLKTLGVKRWLRFVDDVFAVIDNHEQTEKIRTFISSQHNNIRFTVEHESGGKLPFLDTVVIRSIGKYSTSVYHKPTFTGVYLNWTSLTATRYKLALIRCHAERTWRICSEAEDRLKEIEKLKLILYKNNYPVDVVERAIGEFLESKASPPQQKEPETRRKRYLKLPYVGNKCDSFAHDIKKHVEHFFPTVEFNIAWEAPMKLENFFPFKDKIKDVLDRVLVVYSIHCRTCNAEYVGKTKRILSTRLEEHKTDPSSACVKHVKLCLLTDPNNPHVIDYSGVTVIDTASCDQKLRYKELLHILDRKPTLNNQLGSQSDYEANTLIITKYEQFRSDKR